MLRIIKSWLLKILGHEKYLALTSNLFFVYYKEGWLRNNPSYYAHYLVPNLIQRGNTIIDIGANLGYYTRLFAKITSLEGKVLAVEPIELYRKILTQNILGYPQITIIPVALGEREGIIRMGNPTQEKHRHGLMRVLKEDEKVDEGYEVPVKNPLSLFGDLELVHYIKCDIEGYEVPVIPAMKTLLEKWRPIIQVETEGENKILLMELFRNMGYQMFFAGKQKMIPYKDPSVPLPGDLFAIPGEKTGSLDQWIQND